LQIPNLVQLLLASFLKSSNALSRRRGLGFTVHAIDNFKL
jgi:hypothetical protein